VSGDGYRVSELADASGATVDTIRFYQHKGLMDPPQRRGRVAFYSDEHLARLKRIRELQAEGLSLATIARVLSGMHPADAALVSAVTAAEPGPGTMNLHELSDATGVPAGLLETLAAEGFLEPGADGSYSRGDVEAVKAGMELLDAGVPLNELLELGRSYSDSVAAIAERAVDLFDRYVRRPVHDSADEAAAATGLVERFERLMPSAGTLIRHEFERALLAAARERIELAD
jgi:DNA-binding transcriptional MerR regulator